MKIDFDLLEKLTEKIFQIYEEAKNIKELAIKNKEGNDIVTEVDMFMEKNIIEMIKEWFPEH